jgi:hypothetical protein
VNPFDRSQGAVDRRQGAGGGGDGNGDADGESPDPLIAAFLVPAVPPIGTAALIATAAFDML